MFNRLKKLFQPPTDNVSAPRTDVNDKRNKAFDFRGRRRDAEKPGQNTLGVRMDSLLHGLEEHEPKMQTRAVRYKSLGYLFLFGLWNVAVIGFIMYRVRGDDLERLAEEAREKVEKSKRARGD